ncbi:MAG: hypothetical protein ACUVQG_00760 [Thermogutta sp.]
MPIEFSCPQCGNRLRVGDAFAGQQAQCPICAAIVAVPLTGAAGYATYSHGRGFGAEPQTSNNVPPNLPPAGARPQPTGPGASPPPGFGPQPTSYAGYSTPPFVATPLSAVQQNGDEGWGIAATILGIFGLLAWCCPVLGFALGILAIIFGGIAVSKGGVTAGIIGIILGAICLILSLINLVISAALMSADLAWGCSSSDTVKLV